MHFVEYNRKAAAEYAKKWALSRNPEYYSFDGIGGDCTNFASQCLYAGCGVMNFTKDTGWYYISLNNRAPAWSSAEYFRSFLLENRGEGPFGIAREIHQLDIGDFISLSDGLRVYHTLFVVDVVDNMPLVAAHSNDAYNIPLSSYSYYKAMGVHIIGGNIY